MNNNILISNLTYDKSISDYKNRVNSLERSNKNFTFFDLDSSRSMKYLNKIAANPIKYDREFLRNAISMEFQD